MTAQRTVVLGSVIRIGDEEWTVWSDGQMAGRWWAFQRGADGTRWLEVRYVTGADGRKVWMEAR
jgi:hypothetical protein